VMIATWWLTPRTTSTRAWRWQGLLAWALGVAAVLWLQHPLRNLLGPVIAAAAMVVLVTAGRRR